MNIFRAMTFTLLALFLQACASTSPIFAKSDEPHGIVDLDIPQKASGQFQAFFLAVDGSNVDRNRQQLMLRPGKHEVRIGAILDEYAGMSVPGNNTSDNPVVTIEVKVGVRYSVAAQMEGQRTHEWRAVVSRESSIGGDK